LLWINLFIRAIPDCIIIAFLLSQMSTVRDCGVCVSKSRTGEDFANKVVAMLMINYGVHLNRTIANDELLK
jgi:hypothetical protein